MRYLSAAVALVLLIQTAAPALAQYPAASEAKQKKDEEKKKQELTLGMIGLRESELPEDPCERSRIIGEAAGNYQHGKGGWFAGGLLGSFLLGPIGFVGAITIAATADNKPYTFPVEATDQVCYTDQYRSTARRNKVLGAVVGSVLGAAALTAVIVANSD